MIKYSLYFVILLFVFSCSKQTSPSLVYKSNKVHQRVQLRKIIAESKVENLQTTDLQLNSVELADISESKPSENLEANFKIFDKKTVGKSEKMTITKKLTLKDKIVLKAVGKISKKANMNTAATTRGFDSLDRNVQIGLILLGVAVVLSIIGLGGLAGIAGLIGLVFLVLGLINMY